jgi:hypothetical protein
MRHRGQACFDFEMYRKRNPDLPKWGNNDLWEHFVKHGQHEGRVFRWGWVAAACGALAHTCWRGRMHAPGDVHLWGPLWPAAPQISNFY